MDRQYIKQQAKTLISGKVFSLLLVGLATTILTLFSFDIIGDVRDIFEMIRYGGNYGYYYGSFGFGSSIMSLIFKVIAIPFLVGMEAFFVKFIRTGKYEVGEGIKFSYGTAFKNYGKYLWVGFSTKFIIYLWSLLFIIPGIVASLKYYFVNKIIADNPSITDTRARDISNRMTSGYKGELFMLELSFLGWYILVGLTFGLVGIYVLPYVQTTRALYYENCKNRAFFDGRVNPSEMIDPSLPSNIQPHQSAPFGTNQPPMGNQYQPPFANGQPSQPQYQSPIEHKEQPSQPLYQAPIEHKTPEQKADPVDFYNNAVDNMNAPENSQIDQNDNGDMPG